MFYLFYVHHTIHAGMREARVWSGDEADRFKGKFLTYEPQLPENMDLEAFKALGWPSKDHEHRTLEDANEPVRVVANGRISTNPKP